MEQPEASLGYAARVSLIKTRMKQQYSRKKSFSDGSLEDELAPTLQSQGAGSECSEAVGLASGKPAGRRRWVKATPFNKNMTYSAKRKIG